MMSGLDLMKALGNGIRPVETRGGDGLTPSGVAGASFASLLSRSAERGSGLPVTVAPGANVELSKEQLERVAQATDRAEREGASRALILLDGKALRVDVGVRMVTGVADLSGAGAVTGIDAVVVAESAPAAAAVSVPAAGLESSAALMRALSGAPAGL